MSVEQILLRSLHYFRSIFQRSNYCRRSKCHTFGMFGAYFSEAIVGGAIDTGANVAGAIIGGAIVGGANVISSEHSVAGTIVGGAIVGGANVAGANVGGANVAGANVGGANVAGANVSEHLSHFSEQLSAEHLSWNHFRSMVLGNWRMSSAL